MPISRSHANSFITLIPEREEVEVLDHEGNVVTTAPNAFYTSQSKSNPQNASGFESKAEVRLWKLARVDIGELMPKKGWFIRQTGNVTAGQIEPDAAGTTWEMQSATEGNLQCLHCQCERVRTRK